MAGVEEYSEYDGNGPMPNTVYPKGPDALTASDKLRLQSITGQEEDPNAPVDPYFWAGGNRQDVAEYEKQVDIDARSRRRDQQARDRQEVARYRESP